VRILVVEDDVAVRESLKGFLAGKKHDVDWCTTGRDALTAMHKRTYDLVILDMVLDGVMTGWDVAFIKHGDPDLTWVPFVIMTGMRTADVHLGAHTHAASVQAAKCILQKPIDFRLLGSVLASVGEDPPTAVYRRYPHLPGAKEGSGR
jgi:DNA-binding response OmpR family regulator